MSLAPAPCFGAFSSTQTQSIATSPAVTAITYNTTDGNRGGVALSGATPTASIQVPVAGIYSVMFSVQMDKTPFGASPTADVYIWCAVNGTAVPNSGTKTAMSTTIEQVMTAEVLVTVNAGDLISIRAHATSTGSLALAEAAMMNS